MSLLLAIETSSPRGSVAFVDVASGATVASESWNAARHSGALGAAMARHASLLERTDWVAVGLGPGGFTGIRVAVATAQALRLARGAHLIGVCSADAVGAAHPEVTRLGVFADARRDEAYLTIYEHGVRVRGPGLIPNASVEEQTARVTLAVSADAVRGVPGQAFPDAVQVAYIARADALANRPTSGILQPVYLREPTNPKSPQ
jgi:tRNA threonylcarbamoyl adenosine modification protein YeaZ